MVAYFLSTFSTSTFISHVNVINELIDSLVVGMGNWRNGIREFLNVFVI